MNTWEWSDGQSESDEPAELIKTFVKFTNLENNEITVCADYIEYYIRPTSNTNPEHRCSLFMVSGTIICIKDSVSDVDSAMKSVGLL